MRFAVAIAVCTLAALSPAPSAADMIQITSSQDNTLFEIGDGSLSNGSGAHLYVGLTPSNGVRRGLLAFDIQNYVPAGATIDSVTLTLHMSRAFQGPNLVTLHRVLAAWGEGASVAFVDDDQGIGGGGGADSAPGDATWIHTFYNTSFWANPGGDFVEDPSAGKMVGVDVGFYTWTSTSQMVADVQAWLDSPETNFGWLLLGEEDAPLSPKRFDSRENIVAEFRPLLVIEYTPVPEPGSFVLVTLAAIGAFAHRARHRARTPTPPPSAPGQPARNAPCL